MFTKVIQLIRGKDRHISEFEANVADSEFQDREFLCRKKKSFNHIVKIYFKFVIIDHFICGEI